MSSDDQRETEKECPLCMEPFDYDDLNFFPCTCQYQICRFCWHRIRTDENGLCPACRQSYPEEPVFQPLSKDDVRKMKSEKKQRQIHQKTKLAECRKHLSGFRVLQKNLVYVVGLSQRMSDPEILKRSEYFGKFGKILKIAIGAAQTNNSHPSYTAFIHYATMDEALKSIQAVNNLVVDGRLVKASLGTTKYCSCFLKGQTCQKQDCMYLHEVAENEVSFTKEDMHQGKHTEYERKLCEQMSSHLHSSETSSNESSKARPIKSSTSIQRRSKVGRSSEKDRIQTAAGVHKKINNDQQHPRHQRNRGRTKTSALTPRKEIKYEASIRPDETTNENLYPTNLNEFEGKHELKRHNSNTDKNLSQSPPQSETERKLTGTELYSTDVTIDPECVASELNSDKDENNFSEEHPPIQNSSTIAIGDKVMENVNSQALVSPNLSVNYLSEHDDDLGFDPFSESSKALADMLEEERNRPPPPYNLFSFEREFDEERRIDCSQPSPLHNLSRSNHLLDYPPGLEPSSLYSHWNEEPCLRNPRFISNDALITSSVENFGSLHLRDSLDAKSARELASSYNICSYTPLQKEFAVNDSNSNSHTSNGLFEQAFSRNSSFFTNSNLLKQKSLHLGNDLPNSTSSALPPTIPNASYYHDSKSKIQTPQSQSYEFRNHLNQNCTSSQLREGLKALLPNVNIRFMANSEDIDFASHHMNYLEQNTEQTALLNNHKPSVGFDIFGPNSITTDSNNSDSSMWASAPPGFGFTSHQNCQN